jgi:hypothetical protein
MRFLKLLEPLLLNGERAGIGNLNRIIGDELHQVLALLLNLLGLDEYPVAPHGHVALLLIFDHLHHLLRDFIHYVATITQRGFDY